jgi:hypothetical protein
LEGLFPPEHWVHKNPKVVETDQCTLLIQDYQTLPDGRLELKPCALIFHSAGSKAPGADASIPPSRGRPVVLEAPKAELAFDRPLDLARAEFGRVEKGTLSGEVTIHSPPTLQGGRDELFVKTRAVWLDRQSIRTSNDVEFRYGESSGRGRMLEITLAQEQSGQNRARKSPLGGVQTVKLKHLEFLRIATAGGGLLGEASPAGGKRTENQSAPLDITCRGEFAFDVAAQLARFQDRVEVRRLTPDGPPDQLQCDELLLALGSPAAGPTSVASADDPLAGRLQRIIAIGSPAVLKAPASGIEAVAAFMEYSLADRFVTLKSDKQKQVHKVSLHQFGQHFIAPELHYKMADEGRLGRLRATGPGELRLLQGHGASQQTVTARWERELHVQPQGRNHVISLLDAASVTIDPLGRFDANELHLWVLEVPVESRPRVPLGQASTAISTSDAQEAQPKTSIIPDRLLAVGKVRINSPRLDADTSQLEAWFIHLPPPPPAPLPPGGPSGPVREPVQPVAFSPIEPPSAQNVIRPPNLQKFHAGGGLMQMQLMVRGPAFDLEALNIRGQAEIDEIRTPEQGQEPIRVRGEILELRRGTQPDATIDITGRPAEVASRGLSLAGGKIQVFRGDNLMRIDGPGEATVPGGEQGGGGRASGVRSRESGIGRSEPSQKMHIVWQQGFVFDGLTARFNGGVEIRTATQTALTPILEATFRERLDFQAMGGQPQADVAQVFLDGAMTGVYVEGRSFDEFGEQLSREQLRARNLLIDREKGTFHATGPGWVNSVRRGSAGLPGSLGTQSPTPPPQAATPNVPEPLTSVHVAFEREIDGNLVQREVEFRQQVQTTYSPAHDFNDEIVADPLGNLGERMMLMQSDSLKIIEFIQPDNRWFEMRATGHTRVRGSRVDIDAPVVGYSSANEMLTLEGDGRAKAQVWMHRAAGGDPNRMSGERLRYNLRTGEVQTDVVPGIYFNLENNIKLPKVPSLTPAKSKK